MKIRLPVIILVSFAVISTLGCASAEKPVQPVAQSQMEVVSGGQICRSERVLRSRIKKVRCVRRGASERQGVTSMGCTGDPAICNEVMTQVSRDTGG